MKLDCLLDSMNAELRARLQRAVETGKWDNGLPLSTEQREQAMQLLIAYDRRHKSGNPRIGPIVARPAQCGSTAAADAMQPLSIQD
ncbi:MAG: DUF1315 family protein [Cellvibrionales bacterium]|nr:DUF1315 family protein [Cellvibrionales bacterium]